MVMDYLVALCLAALSLAMAVEFRRRTPDLSTVSRAEKWVWRILPAFALVGGVIMVAAIFVA
jgi:hypothetical protein